MLPMRQYRVCQSKEEISSSLLPLHQPLSSLPFFFDSISNSPQAQMSRPSEQDRNQEATCYVGNLDDSCTDSLLWELMIQAGPLANLHLPKDRITSNHQGFAFAEFLTEQDANYACQILNGIKLFGKPLRVNKAAAGNDRKVLDVGANLFVGNLDGGVDERLLYESFSQFGTLMGMPKIARDPVTNQSKSYAFVAFSSFEASDAALESLNNQYLLNRPITVTYALKKDGKNGERHGTPAERLLAAQARKNNALPGSNPTNGLDQPQGGWKNSNGAPLSSMGMMGALQPTAGFGGPPPPLHGQGGMPLPNGNFYSGPPPVGPPPPSMNGYPPQQQGFGPPPQPDMGMGGIPMYSGPPPISNGGYGGGYGRGQGQAQMTGSNMAPLGPRGSG